MSLDTYEATLKNQQFIGGQAPTQADVEAFN
jgi:glutathionyl-hydroquinone reductase